MNTPSRHVKDELSAYIDGMAHDADRVVEHLTHCQSCRHHYEELLGLSAHLRALPQREVSPAFAARVLASIREAEPEQGLWDRFVSPMRRHWPAAALVTASLALMIALFGGGVFTSIVRPHPVAQVAVRTAPVDELSAMAEIARRAEEETPADSEAGKWLTASSENDGEEDKLILATASYEIMASLLVEVAVDSGLAEPSTLSTTPDTDPWEEPTVVDAADGNGVVYDILHKYILDEEVT